jgi:glyoxylase-like metal-dependent hydrolase (beta-lactamase superfamily II)
MEIKIIDLGFMHPKVIASYLVDTREGPFLIETGPDTTFENLARALGELGYSTEDIKKVFVTHIHLDHSGAAWHFARSGSTIYVHPNGARHLADPTKLLASARMIYKEQMEELWGRVEPIDTKSLHPLGDGETVVYGGVEIRAIQTFGHASHHNSYLVENAMFTGDSGGIRIENERIIPPTPPPDVNIEEWINSIEKMMDTKADLIYPTHFGEFKNAAEHFSQLRDNLLMFTDWVGKRLKEGKGEDEITREYDALVRRMLLESGASEETVKAYELADPFWMNVLGLVRYWRKFRTQGTASI